MRRRLKKTLKSFAIGKSGRITLSPAKRMNEKLRKKKTKTLFYRKEALTLPKRH